MMQYSRSYEDLNVDVVIYISLLYLEPLHLCFLISLYDQFDPIMKFCTSLSIPNIWS